MIEEKQREYLHCYAVLGLRLPCEWQDVRIAYRRRVHRCHPDLEQSAVRSPEREAEFRRVVRAYHQLAAYRRAHGKLPCVGPKTSAARALPARIRIAERPFHFRARASVLLRRCVPRLHQAAFALFVTGVGSAALLEEINHAESREVRPATNEKLSLGMDPLDVVNVQGVPSYTKGSVWFYGESGVIFDGDCVIGWENQPPFPLRTLVHAIYSNDTGKRLDRGPGCARSN